MAKKDYYEILGISKSSGEREIKKAYKRLAIKYHPDRNQYTNTENKFKEIKEAYEVLIDPKKRSAYDQYGHNYFEQNNMGNSEFATNADFSDIFGDVFGDIFGGGRNQKNAKRGADLCYSIELSLEESVKGVLKEIRISSLEECHICHGSGAKSGTKPQVCSSCRGMGQIQMRQGFFTVQQTCPRCHGQGSIIKEYCNICRGHGQIEKPKTLSIKIPAGVDTGDRIRLSGKGSSGKKGSKPGDLYVQIKISKHHLFTRKENNLYCDIPISFYIAALGGEIEVPTLNGHVKLKIPPETQTSKLFRIRGKGIKSIQNRMQGDLICQIIVETPVNLNEKQKILLQNLEESFKGSSGEKNRPRSKKFFDSVKKFFDDLAHY